MAKTMNGRNYFNEENFNEMCEALESGEHISVYIDCIGFTRNNMEQDAYRKAFEKKYGQKLRVTWEGPDHCYSYSYKLVGEDEDKYDREEVYKFLDELRDCGETNMFGAGPYLRRKFGMSQEESWAWLREWMDDYEGKEEK